MFEVFIDILQHFVPLLSNMTTPTEPAFSNGDASTFADVEATAHGVAEIGPSEDQHMPADDAGQFNGKYCITPTF